MASHKSMKSKTSTKSKKLSALPQEDLNKLAKVKWTHMQTDLKSALDDWQVEQTSEKVKTPDEQQLDKVKSLIEDLKNRLNEF